jgi:hypothetical protein
LEVIMGEMPKGLLSRDEMELVKYYRGLSSQQQFEILESAEHSFNAAKRMEELAGREVEKGFPRDESRWS